MGLWVDDGAWKEGLNTEGVRGEEEKGRSGMSCGSGFDDECGGFYELIAYLFHLSFRSRTEVWTEYG